MVHVAWGTTFLLARHHSMANGSVYKYSTQKRAPDDSFGAMHPMSYSLDNKGCTKDQLLNSSQQCSFLWAVFIKRGLKLARQIQSRAHKFSRYVIISYSHDGR